MKEDVFTKIQESVDTMAVQLKQENTDDIKHSDWCIEEDHQNDLQNEEMYNAKSKQQQRTRALYAPQAEARSTT